MNYVALIRDGLEMPGERILETLKGILQDERGAAIAGWLEKNREQFIKEFSTPEAADNPTRLAHAAGAMHCIGLLRAQLAQVVNPPPVTGMTPPEPDEEERDIRRYG